MSTMKKTILETELEERRPHVKSESVEQIDLAEASVALPYLVTDDKEKGAIEIGTMPAVPSLVDGELTRTATRRSVMTVREERILLAVLCFGSIVCGWNDGTLGPLLPTIQDSFNLTYTIVSMLFLTGCIGMIIGSCSVVFLTDKLGFGKIMVLVGCIEICAYSMLAAGPPFPVMCVAYLLTGFSMATQGAQAQTFVASMPRHKSTYMGCLHAFYGFGALCSPLVATQFAQMKHWSYHWLTSLGIAMVNLALVIVTFRFKPQDYFIPETEQETSKTVRMSTKYKEVLSKRLVQIMSVFILIYVGIEVTTGGWVVTFLERKRHGGPSSGYVSSGFFAGLMLGRVGLLPVTKKIGRQRAVFMYSVAVLTSQLTIWFVPNLIENAVAVSFVGLFLGPIYPVSINVAAAILPSWILAGAIGFIGAFGQVGSALFPFMTGAVANKYGVQVLQPMTVALTVIQTILWFFIARSPTTTRKD